MQSKIKSIDKTHINIVVIGHVDSGKSTTTGHLIFKLGNPIDQKRQMQKSEKQSIENGKGDSCKFAYFMDTSKEEQKRGITINVSTGQFETNIYKFTIIDAPGHKDFIKNMISGTAQADAALLMISAVPGEFEAGFSKDGTTKEHAILAYSLGVKQIIVCVNKMDEKTVNFSKARFEEITEEVGRWLKKIGFNKIPFIPISGFNGDNLIERRKDIWYEGPTLVEALDALIPPIRLTNKPLRMPISEIYKIQGIGTVVSGRIETGQIVLGQSIEIGPLGIKTEVKSIEMHHQQLKSGTTGDCVGINIRGVSATEIKKGFVLGDAKNDPPKEAVSFIAQIIITNHPGQIKAGFTPVIDLNTSHIPCKFTKILSKIDKKTNKVIEENPQFVQANDCAMVEITPLKPMVVEEFSVYPPLGRFSVRDSNKSVAVGIVKQVVKKL